MNKKKYNKKISDILYRSFDGELSGKEHELLANALEHFADLRKEQQQITIMRRMIAEKGGGQFVPFFTTRVMQRINSIQAIPDRAAEFFDSLMYFFRRVALVGGIAVIVLFSIQLIQKDTRINLVSDTITEMTLDDVLGSAFSTSLEEVL